MASDGRSQERRPQNSGPPRGDRAGTRGGGGGRRRIWLALVCADSRLFGGRKIGRDRLRDFAGGGPFGAALKGNDKADAGEGWIRRGFFWAHVAERGVKHAAFAVGEGHEHRLVFAAGVGMSGF